MKYFNFKNLASAILAKEPMKQTGNYTSEMEIKENGEVNIKLFPSESVTNSHCVDTEERPTACVPTVTAFKDSNGNLHSTIEAYDRAQKSIEEHRKIAERNGKVDDIYEILKKLGDKYANPTSYPSWDSFEYGRYRQPTSIRDVANGIQRNPKELLDYLTKMYYTDNK